MKTLGLFETKNKLSEVCENVASSGEPVVVTRHGKPLVRIVPVTMDDTVNPSVWDTVAESSAKYGELRDELVLPPRHAARNRKSPIA